MSPLLSELDLDGLRERMAERLAAIRRSLRRHFLLEGTAILLGVAVLVAALSLLVDWQLELSRPVRIACLVASLGGLAWLAYRHVVRPMSMPLSPLDVAAAIDRTSGGSTHAPLATRVASVLELPEQAHDTQRVSPDLIVRAVAADFEELERVDFRRHLNGRHWWLSALAVAGFVLIPTAFAIGAPKLAGLWRDRWLLGSNRPWPHSTLIEVQNLRDGRLIVPRGEPAAIQVRVTDSDQETETVWLRMTGDDGNQQTVTMNRFAAGDFRFDLPPLQQPVEGELWGGDGRSEPFRIEPMDRPKITSLKLTGQHPRDPAPQEFVFTGEEGNVRLLPQTNATLAFETNVPVAEVRVEEDATPAREFSRESDRKFVARWIHGRPVKMRVSLVAADSGLESFPRPITIGEKPDRAPTLSLRHSGVRLRVTTMATIPVTVAVRDDYGIRSVELIAAVDHRANPAKEVDGEPAAEEGAAGSDPDAPPADPASPAAEPATGEGSPPPGAKPEEKPAESPTKEAVPAEAPKDPPPAPQDAVTQSADEASYSFTAVLADDAPAAAESTTPDSTTGAVETPAEDGGAAVPEVAKVLPTELRSMLYGPAEPAIEAVVEKQEMIELSQMSVQPGQSVSISVVAEDDSFTGRQSAQSRKLVFRVVKEDELFREILLRQQQLRARLRKAYEQMIDLRDKLKSSDVQAEGSNLLRSYLLTRREIGAITRELEASVLEMRLNKLGGAESWDLIDQLVLKPLNALQQQELERQKQALESFTGERPEPVEEVLERQQAIIDALQKVLNNMSQWDSFIDIVNQVNSIIKIQEAARKMTDSLKEKQTESIFDQ